MSKFLKKLLEDEGISQAKLSRESGVSTTTINKICTKNLGTKVISPTTKGKITKAVSKLTGREYKAGEIKFQ